MSILLTILLGATMLCQGADRATSDDEFRDGFYWCAQIGKGVNLGNALEAPEEGDWGVHLKSEYFYSIQSAGFTSVRIPIRWSAHAQSAPPYTIDPAFFLRIDWAVEQALSRGLVAIVNLHHYEELVTAPREHKQRFLALWKQIAEHYRDRPPTLYFEILNEPCRKLTDELWNDYLVEALRVIRRTNPRRAVVVGPGNWNNTDRLKNLALPEDDRNLVVTFHYYQPFPFTHQGASWVGEHSNKWLGTPWTGTDAEKRAVAAHLDQAARWGRQNRRPLYMGEFGAYSKADMPSRVRWTRFVRAAAEQRDIPWTYWEFCAGFGVYDPEAQAWHDDLLKALIPSRSEEKGAGTP